MSEEIDYAARVAKGFALFDEKWPNWATEIDLDTLDIQSGYVCATAQYAKTHNPNITNEIEPWIIGMKMLGLDNAGYTDHGFRTSDDFEERRAYPILNGLWKAEIERRRALT